jgi:ribosomal protein RSM22 (predicted rRNA methylase)
MNRSPQRNPGSGSKTTTSSRAISKRPRAINSVDLFAKEHKTNITERMAEQQDKEGGIPKQVNLTRYHKIKHELYDQLTEEEQRAYEAKAAKTNEGCKAQPDASEIFR